MDLSDTLLGLHYNQYYNSSKPTNIHTETITANEAHNRPSIKETTTFDQTKSKGAATTMADI